MRFTDVAVLSQALASGLVASKPIEKRQTGASTVQSVGSYSYIGCAIEPFANGGNGRTLTNTSQSSNTMTVESCASFCSDYAYFSVEWSSECYCGDELMSGTGIEADDTNCNFPCAGDSTEFCGGSGHQNLYSGPRASGSNLVTTSSVSSTTASSPSTSSAVLASTTASATASTTSAVASGNAYKYVTCAVEPFQNGVDSRALIDDSTSDDNSMTVEYCASYCAGYTFFAVEYSSQCYCGNTIQTGTTQDVGDHCNMPCSGNSLEQCGGPGVMNLYEVSSGPAVTLPTTYSPATSTSSAAAVSTTAAVVSTSAAAVSTSPAAVSTSAATSTSAAVVSTSAAAVSTSAAAVSTSASSSAVASVSMSSSAVASSPKASSGVASTSAASSSVAVSTSAAAKPASSTTQASSAAPASASSVTSSRAASSTASSFVTSTTAARTSTSASATKASTTAAATASATPSSFFSIATCPKLTASLGALRIKQTFTPYFSGSGVTENCVNPGSSFLFAARTFQIAGTNNACAAATLCLQQMSNLLVSYQSFDLHYRTDTARWECVAYKYNNVQGSYFNVRNPAVSVAYGFNGAFF